MNSYIHKIYVHNNYVKKNFEIDISADQKEGFKNLILTGKNGVGKSVLLKTINKELFFYKTGIIPPNVYFNLKDQFAKKNLMLELDKLAYNNPKVEIEFGEKSNFLKDDLLVINIPSNRFVEIDKAQKTKKLNLPQAIKQQTNHIEGIKNSYINYANMQRQIFELENRIKDHHSKVELLENEVKNYSAKKADYDLNELNKKIHSERTQIASKTKTLKALQSSFKNLKLTDSKFSLKIALSKFIHQYLVDTKEKQAYAFADDEKELISSYNKFFKDIEDVFKYLFEEEDLELKHVFKESRFYFKFSDGRTSDFNEIADGFKSVLIILSEIILQREAFKEEKKLSENPPGIVLIDEIETHLHVNLQEKILPALTNFFPNLQFIVATHSPQICASDDNSYIFDLNELKLEKEYIGGISYDVISKEILGMNSEYSLVVTNKLNEAKKILSKKKPTKKEITMLTKISEYLSKVSPELSFEIMVNLNTLKNKHD